MAPEFRRFLFIAVTAMILGILGLGYLSARRLMELRQTEQVSGLPGATSTPTRLESTAQATETISPPQVETTSLTDLTAGLENLSSYRLSFTLSLDGRDTQGQPADGQLEILQTVNRIGQEQFLSYIAGGEARPDVNPETSRFELYTLGGQSFLFNPEDMSCTGISDLTQPAQVRTVLTLEELTGVIEDARLVERGVLKDGQTADHYSFDQSNLPERSFVFASGEFWIAQEGGYVMRFTGQARGQSPLFPRLAGVTLTWDYAVEAIDPTVSLAAPSECSLDAPPQDIPVPENATDRGSFSGMLTFTSPDAPQVIADFYRSQMAAGGWVLQNEKVVDSSSTLEFGREGRTVSILINRNESDGSAVLVRELP